MAQSAGIFVSIPFCAQKCTYCNFRSDVYSRGLRTDYLECLATEIEADDLGTADTLYFGGGSPSLLDPFEFGAVADRLPARDWSEATIEVAPGEANRERIAAWTKGGINRASLGVQSFDPAVARAAGRQHDPETVRADALRLAQAGIRNLSVDLIAGLAFQSRASWQRSLDWVARLNADHVSVYMLESDDASRLGREIRAGGQRYGAPSVPGEDLIVDLYQTAVERLGTLGYERYEVSNFARPGKRSRHNLKYWSMQPYLGFGSDAHSFDGSRRWANAATAPEYVRLTKACGSARTACEELGPRRILEDRLLTGLRTSGGVRLDCGDWDALEPRVTALVDRGLLVVNKATIRLTDSGLLFADEATAELLS